MIKDMQKDLATMMFDVPLHSTQPALDFFLTWPWLRNTAWAVPGFKQNTSSARAYLDYFVDPELREQFG